LPVGLSAAWCWPTTLGHWIGIRATPKLICQLPAEVVQDVAAEIIALVTEDFKLQCPVSAMQRVRGWDNPDKCPRCGVYLEKSALPYRFWD
jgi:hypothetical protein